MSGWITKADRMNKDFFATFRQRPSDSTLRAITDSIGVVQTHLDTVLGTVTEYFASTFTVEEPSAERLHAQEEIWACIEPTVTPEMSESLLRPFTMWELEEAVTTLDASSCPGDDGLTPKFF